MPTNKKILMKGLTYMGWALPLFFLGPVVIHISFKNEGHPLFIPVLGLGIIFCFLAILFMAKGIKTIINSLFENEN
ncbi:hypothetical protein GCM10007424_01730 [Flavobacterium suaedae]|uniref:Uncharacterized protein n=2 Tax=Flavobacterium suaedae TaxID=1767027 RepID=A0ABQ1JEU1_9FLAO|nr:hypothetical protein GCM10007424_01730 [Flavobacterium suaedae]